MIQSEYQKIVEYGPVPGKGGILASAENYPDQYDKIGRMSVSTGKLLNPGKYRQQVESCEYRKTVRTSTGKWLNQCEHQKIVESGRVPGKG